MHIRWFIMALALLVLSTASSAQVDDISIKLDKFGIGSVARAGELAAIRLDLINNTGEPRQVWVHWEVPNPDQDIAEYGRVITLAGSESIWLYAPLPFDIDQNGLDPWTIHVHEYEDGQRGNLLASTAVRAADDPSMRIVSARTGLIGVIGPMPAGLAELSYAMGTEPSPAAHEPLVINQLIQPIDLPDRWEGLRQYESIIWMTDSQHGPDQLNDRTSDAIIQYVRNGGHLIIILPPNVDSWELARGDNSNIYLRSLLPPVAPRTYENVPLNNLLDVLSKTPETRTRLDINAGNNQTDLEIALQVFASKDKQSLEALAPYQPLISLEDGRVIVVERPLGFGAITVIGIDLSDSDLARSLPSLPQADIFWNRVLGRRADTPTPTEIADTKAADRFALVQPTWTDLGEGQLFSQATELQQRAGQGLILALLLFLLYWAVAGPGSFFLLKRYRMTQHAWIVFAACSIAFTAITWGSVSILQRRELNLQHVTVLDHIALADEAHQQRASSWFTVFLPMYGDPEISLNNPTDNRDLLYPWKGPKEIRQGFPNRENYQVDVGQTQSQFQVPARATSSHFFSQWRGGVDPDQWGSLLRIDPSNPPRVITDEDGRETSLAGAIISELPSELEDISIIWITNERNKPRSYATNLVNGDREPWIQMRDSGDLLDRGYLWTIDAISPGEVINLSLPTTPAFSLETALNDSYYKAYQKSTQAFSGLRNIAPSVRRRHLEALSFYNQLTPPTYLKSPNQNEEPALQVQRWVGRSLDLGRWLSRPCIIIMGYMPGSTSPMPIQLEGNPDAIPSTGLTLFRWIYPLPTAIDQWQEEITPDDN
ncbi:MAG: hypothetical protein P8J86_10800 [Phycisphaerales bacterium]|nr:hypothetical protein [Phycisphaerales bacterium]